MSEAIGGTIDSDGDVIESLCAEAGGELVDDPLKITCAKCRELAACAPSSPEAPTATTSNYDRSLHDNPDAVAWAKEFCRLHGGDEELMVSWFANAMMAMHDYHHKLPPASAPPPADTEEVSEEQLTKWERLALDLGKGEAGSALWVLCSVVRRLQALRAPAPERCKCGKYSLADRRGPILARIDPDGTVHSPDSCPAPTKEEKPA